MLGIERQEMDVEEGVINFYLDQVYNYTWCWLLNDIRGY